MALTLKYVLVLTAAMAASVASTLAFGYDARSSVTAAWVVWVAGTLGMIVATLPATASQRVSCALAGMALRMSLPLLALAAWGGPGHGTKQTMAGLLVFHYLAGLAIETPLIVRRIQLRDASLNSENVTRS
ncbi:MAG: hypothetical protein KDA61_06490 [Planctomycetales bacterium]|nr:hypothetical protein [Planctomycetales bacterium]